MIARAAASAGLARLEEGRIEVREGERRRVFGPAGAPLNATIEVRSPRFWTALLRGSVGLARSYAAGEWDCDDLVALVRIGAREMPRLDRLRRPFVPVRNGLTRIPRNTRSGAREHVAAHYDLGNDLFELFLDETMTYSCAVFDSAEATLAEAQERKLDLVCRRLGLGPDDHVLEIGTGWGSFALHAAGRYGCRVTTTTISAEQHAAAVERVAVAGLSDRVRVLSEDYRDLTGRYDKLVSIEMIEAVGWQYFDRFFQRCHELLHPGGSMLLQAIVIDDAAYEAEKASHSFIRELVFPSGCLPSTAVIDDCVKRMTDMRTLAREDITEHYPETLRRWRKRFLGAADRAERLGYDERFRRLWELYFAYCEGGFRERRIRVVQTTLAKRAHRAAPPRERLEAAASFS